MLETERLLIRPHKKADLEALYAYRNDPEVARYQGWDIPYPRERAIKWIAKSTDVVPSEPGGSFSAALELRATGAMIGGVSFALSKDDVRQAHIGYTLARAYWHQGYATEAIQRLLAYLFDELGLHRVVAETDVLNEPSWRLLERLGFRREAHLVEAAWFRGAYESEYHYAMLRREWEERHVAAARERGRQGMEKSKQRLTLDRPATYQIRVPGHIGEGDQMVDDQPPVRVRPGAAIYIPQGVVHSTINAGWEPMRLVVVYVPSGAELELRADPGVQILPAGT